VLERAVDMRWPPMENSVTASSDAVGNLIKHVEVGTLLALPRREPISGRDRTPFLGKSKRKFENGAQSRALMEYSSHLGKQIASNT
jgi:hypothetical protein